MITTTMQKWGNSQGIRIPKILLEMLQWSDEEILTMVADNDKIIIERASPKKNIIELFADYEGEYTPVEVDWGEAVGGEVW